MTARRVLVLLAGLLVALAVAGPAAAAVGAHPLGNASTNVATRVVVAPDALRVLHVVDLAELRTVPLLAEFDVDGDGALSDAEAADLASGTCTEAAADLGVTADGRPLALRVDTATTGLVDGQGGLPTSRTECRLLADVSVDDPTSLAVDASSVLPGRAGWREVTVVGDRTTVTAADVPADSPSDLLRDYPEVDALSGTPDVRLASATVRPGGPPLADDDVSAVEDLTGPLADGPLGFVADAFDDLVGRPDLTPGVALVALGLSVVVGAGHALAPGHGKTLLAAYLVAERGGRRQALLLGGVVTATHTAGVLLLGLAVSLTASFAPDAALVLLGLAAGVLVGVVGAVLLRRAVRASRAPARQQHTHDHDAPPALVGAPAATTAPAGAPDGHPHEHVHADGHAHLHHDHDHGDHHDHDGHGHGHGRFGHVHGEDLEDRHLRPRDLVAVGVVGGLVPSPSALVVLLGAVALGRPWFGVLLVLGYGLGMAALLVAAGALALRGQRWLAERAASSVGGRLAAVSRLLPLVTAGLLVVVGVVLTVRGVLQVVDVLG